MSETRFVSLINTGPGLAGGPVTDIGTISMANTGVTAGTYTLPSLILTAQGQVSSASNTGIINNVLFNIFVGENSGSSSTTGASQTTFGTGPLANQTSGDFNNFFSYGSGANLISSSPQNNGFGVNVLSAALQANGNTAFGQSCLHFGNLLTNNCAFGGSSMQTCTDGVMGNVALGYNSFNPATSSNNVCVGANTLTNIAGTGGYNVCIGAGAGAGSGSENYTNCTFIGANSGGSSASLTNSTAIGINCVVSTSNSFVFGPDVQLIINLIPGFSIPNYCLYLGPPQRNVTEGGGLAINSTTLIPTAPAIDPFGIVFYCDDSEKLNVMYADGHVDPIASD